MKNLFICIVILFSSASMACQLSIPSTYIPTFLSPPVIGHYEKCEDRPLDRCVCVDGVDPWTSKVVAGDLGEDVFVVDQKKVSAKQAAEAAAKALEVAMAQAIKAMDCGRRTQAYLLVRNATKGLSKPQVKSLVSTYRAIKDLLDTGSLASAAEEIAAITADGTIVTEQDKLALVNFLNSCKP